MPELVVTALLAPSRLSLSLLRFCMWVAVYAAALLAAAAYTCAALLGVLCRPRLGCCGRPRSSPPACLRDPALGDHRFLELQSSGLRLHYVSAGHGNGPLLLFLHGFPETWFSWRHQLREFGPRFHAVAVDMRGYGGSDKPSGVDSYTVDLLAADVRDMVHGLGYSKCVLVAHDWGGVIAWHVSTYYPALVERMVVISAPPRPVFQEFSLRHVTQLFRSNYMFLFQLRWLPEKLLSMSDFQLLKTILAHYKRGIPQLSPSELEACLYDFTQPGGLTGPLNYYRNLFRDLPLEPQELSTPTLLLWGDQDPVLDKRLVDAIGAHFVPGRLEAHVLPGVGHWAPQSHAALVHHYMWAFLGDLPR